MSSSGLTTRTHHYIRPEDVYSGVFCENAQRGLRCYRVDIPPSGSRGPSARLTPHAWEQPYKGYRQDFCTLRLDIELLTLYMRPQDAYTG